MGRGTGILTRDFGFCKVAGFICGKWTTSSKAQLEIRIPTANAEHGSALER
jgi:hypothetical protein